MEENKTTQTEAEETVTQETEVQNEEAQAENEESKTQEELSPEELRKKKYYRNICLFYSFANNSWYNFYFNSQFFTCVSRTWCSCIWCLWVKIFMS